MDEKELNLLSEQVIGCAYKVGNALGSGFLEKVYENALAHEIRKIGLKAEVQKPLYVRYDGVVVGEYFADLLIENILIVELKVSNGFSDSYKAQCNQLVEFDKVTALFADKLRQTASRNKASLPVPFPPKHFLNICVHQRPTAVNSL